MKFFLLAPYSISTTTTDGKMKEERNRISTVNYSLYVGRQTWIYWQFLTCLLSITLCFHPVALFHFIFPSSYCLSSSIILSYNRESSNLKNSSFQEQSLIVSSVHVLHGNDNRSPSFIDFPYQIPFYLYSQPTIPIAIG